MAYFQGRTVGFREGKNTEKAMKKLQTQKGRSRSMRGSVEFVVNQHSLSISLYRVLFRTTHCHVTHHHPKKTKQKKGIDRIPSPKLTSIPWIWTIPKKQSHVPTIIFGIYVNFRGVVKNEGKKSVTSRFGCRVYQPVRKIWRTTQRHPNNGNRLWPIWCRSKRWNAAGETAGVNNHGVLV